MVHTRETRPAAAEVKFVIGAALVPGVSAWMRAHLEPDPHGTGPCGDEYDTTTLYFDTRTFDVFHRRESYGRAKYRIRRYGESGAIFLERKLRKPGLLIKRRTVEALAALERLRQPANGTAWAGHWFQRRLHARRLRPVCQVSYHRVARILPCADGVARVTLDTDPGAKPAHDYLFASGAGLPFLERHAIVELKYRVRPPAMFRRLVEEFALQPQAASKYRLAVAALGHVTSPREPEVLTEGDISYV
jgi:hypothetical protein